MIIAVFVAAGIASLISNISGHFDVAVFFVSFLIAVVVLFIGFFILSRPTIKGKLGERRVNRVLKGLSKKYGGHFIHDIVVKGEDGKTSQIDHVYVCTRGVFVIETKNYAGRIYGDEKQKYWTQVLAYGNSKNKLYNPLMQNYTHIRRLKESLPMEIDMVSAVVFVKDNIRYINAENVYDLRGLKQLIGRSEIRYSESKVDSITMAIESYKSNPVMTDEEHVANIKETQRNIERGICPRCGGELVLRASKRNGKRFYGCSNYPECTFMKDAE